MNARLLAFEMLCDICIHKSYSTLLLRQRLNQGDAVDKGLITQIVYGTLQNARLVRYQWERYVHKLPRKDIAIVLDMSVYQLLYMDHVPAYAIIHEAVHITKKEQCHQAQLVNAVLRQVQRFGRQAVNDVDAITKIAIETSHPNWVVTMWKAQYGEEVMRSICYENICEKPHAMRVNLLRTKPDRLLQQANCFQMGKLSPVGVWYRGKDVVHTPYYQQGDISIQDEASQMVVYALDPQPKESILDVCSAPGTKACHMAERMQDMGRIVCGDIHAHRVSLIKEGAKRLHLHILEPICMDATTLAPIQDQVFDRVLCDVPCSGYGVLARKSDIKYHMNSTDMDSLIPLQRSILMCGAKHVKQGGVLVYSTCTLNKKENEKQIEFFLHTHDDFYLVEQRTIFPYLYHSDGFFMAKLLRK